jgi:hypothetical protein
MKFLRKIKEYLPVIYTLVGLIFLISFIVFGIWNSIKTGSFTYAGLVDFGGTILQLLQYLLGVLILIVLWFAYQFVGEEDGGKYLVLSLLAVVGLVMTIVALSHVYAEGRYLVGLLAYLAIPIGLVIWGLIYLIKNKILK